MSCGIRLASCVVCMHLAYRVVVDAHHCSETRIGILRALIERAAALKSLEDEICEVSLYRICRILSLALVRMHACMHAHSPDRALFLFYLSSFLLLYIARSLSSLDLSSLSFYTARSPFFHLPFRLTRTHLPSYVMHDMPYAPVPSFTSFLFQLPFSPLSL